MDKAPAAGAPDPPREKKVLTIADLLDPPGAAASSALDAKLEDIADGEAFAQAVLGSLGFRRYIINGLTLGDLPPAILGRLIDHGWGKPPERVEHTGKDGGPLLIQEVRSIIVDPKKSDDA